MAKAMVSFVFALAKTIHFSKKSELYFFKSPYKY